MASELNFDKLVRDLRKNPDMTQSEAADSQGLSIGQVNMLRFCKAQVEAGIWDEIPATTKAVKAARNEGNRWELIAARAGISRAKVIDLFGGEDAARDSYVGRGRNFNATESNSGSKSKSSGSSKKTSGRPSAGKTGTAKRGGRQVTRSTGRPSSRRGGGNPS